MSISAVPFASERTSAKCAAWVGPLSWTRNANANAIAPNAAIRMTVAGDGRAADMLAGGIVLRPADQSLDRRRAIESRIPRGSSSPDHVEVPTDSGVLRARRPA